MMIEQKTQQRDPRTQFTLENCLRMNFHPRGIREFMDGMNKELELGPNQSSFNRYVGTSVDVIKYVAYAALIGRLAYEVLAK